MSIKGDAKKNIIVDVVFIALSVIVYHLFFWDRYIGIQEGWGNAYAALMQQGRVLYGDLYTFTQPLSILLSYILSQLFGNAILPFRVWGIFERVLMGILLYLIYKRLANRRVALIASVASVILYTGVTLDVIYDYVQTCLLFVLLSTYLISTYIARFSQGLSDVPNRFARRYFIASGICSGLAFITKQTIGTIAPLAMLIFLLIYGCAKYKRFSWRYAGYYLFGLLLPIFCMLVVLSYYHIVYDYFSQVFLSAVESKGGVAAILFGAPSSPNNKEFLESGREGHRFIESLPVAVLLCGLYILQDCHFSKKANSQPVVEARSSYLPWLMVSAAFIVGYIVSLCFTRQQLAMNYFLDRIIFLFVAFDWFILLAIYYLARLIIGGRLKDVQWQWLFLCMVSLGIMYAHALSYAYTVYAMILAWGMLVILLYSIVTPFNSLKDRMLHLMWTVLIGMALIQHCEWPYNWWGWSAPSVKEATVTVDLKPLAGIKMSLYSAYVFSDITRLIRSNSQPTDTIYVFPHMPIFYLLADRYPSTWSMVDYFDVCSDRCAKEDALRILKVPPKVMVIETFPADAWRFHEYAFRQGKLSGQRTIINSIDKLINRYAYKKVAFYPSTVDNFTIDVWVRG